MLSPCIHEEIDVSFYRNGIKFGKTLSSKKLQDFLSLPFSVYLSDLENKIQKSNVSNAIICGFDSEKTIIGKSLEAFLTKHSALKISNINRKILESHHAQLVDEEADREDGVLLQTLSLKLPCYNAENIQMGVMGFSIVRGIHPLAKSLQKLIDFGLLKKESENQIIFSLDNVSFTKKEIQTIQLLIKGKTSKEIAVRLNLSSRTIEHRIESLKTKLNVNKKSELIEKLLIYKYESLI